MTSEVIVKRFAGNKTFLWVLIFLFWPAAIIYYMANKKPYKVQVKE